MIEKQITAKITFYSIDELSESEKMLIEAAKSAAKSAYAPYSGFQVGAAVLLENGEVHIGNNQENAAYPSGICAERVALFHAHAVRPDTPVCSMAVAACQNQLFVQEPVSPCGSCRQVLLETERRFRQPIRVLMYGQNRVAVLDSANDLLPFAFDDSALI